MERESDYPTIELDSGPRYVYRVTRIASMYDGDSVNVVVHSTAKSPDVSVDFGFGDIIQLSGTTVSKETPVSVRMHGYDTPELRDRRPDWKAAAYLARDRAREWMEKALAAKTMDGLFMRTYKDRTGKYGRYLATFHVDKAVEEGFSPSLGDYLIRNFLAVPYHGQSKADVESAHQANVDKLKTRGLV